MEKTLHFTNYIQKLKKELFTFFLILACSLGFAQTITPTKTVTIRPGVCGKIDVELKIQGANPVSRPLEVVLVIDVSGSMAEGNDPKPLTHAQDAAIDFINKTFLPVNNPTGKNKISIVKYNSTATTIVPLTLSTGQADLIDAINALTANGSTNVEDGIIKANKELTDHGTFDCVTSRSIVLLTDGVANRVGNNQSCSKGQSGDCIQFAITAAANAKSTTISNVVYNNQIFCVGLFGAISGSDQTNAEYTLNNIQSAGAYFTESAADLTAIYGQIFTQLSWVAQQITDTPFDKETVSSDFTIGTVTPSKGTASVSDQVISWNIDFLNVETITLTYELTPKSNVCGTKTVSTSRLDYKNSACSNTFLDIATLCTNIPCPSVTLATHTNVNCFGDSTGTITINDATGGTGAYSYAWKKNGVAFAVTQNLTGLEAGTYTVIATDANGCNSSELSVCIVQPHSGLCIGVISKTDVNCYNDATGFIDLAISGGTSPYSFAWKKDGNAIPAIIEDLSGIAAGTYELTVNDAKGCTATKSVNIGQPQAPLTCSITQNKAISSNGLSDGEATVTPLGGNDGYTYLWDNGKTTQKAVGLNAGLHSIKITDSKGCETTCDITITQPNVLSCSINQDTPAKCYGDSNGVATVTTIGGNGDYTFLWDNGETTAQAVGLNAGSHTVTTTDKLGYKTTCNIVIGQPQAILSATAIVINNNNCKACSNGSVDLTVSGGTSPYTFLWSNGDTTEDISNVSNGLYSVEIKDKNGCVANYTFVISESSINITKDGTYVDSNKDGITNVGDVVTYNFVITNTGNVPLTNITLTDNNAVIIGGPIATLAPGASDSTTFSGSHTITQTDINTGYVYNLATATGHDPEDKPVTDTSSDPTPCITCPKDPQCPDCTITELNQSPGLVVIKTTTTASYSIVGDVINYTIIVKNTGNVTLHQITVTDPLTGLNTIIDVLAPGASSEYTQSYTVTQEDLNRGSVTNVAKADGFTPNETPISATDDEIVNEKTNVIDAVDDNAGPIDGINGVTNVLNVFNNDTLNTNAVNPADVILTLVTPEATGYITMNTDGSIDVKENTPAGTYILVYQICEKRNTTNCDTAIVTITVTCNDATKISGIVFNAGSNIPLSNVPVNLIPQGNTTGSILIRITNADGYYNFTGMVPGNYLVQVQDANLNSAHQLYPVNSSLFFTTLENCVYQKHDFGYDKSDLPVLGDFVWYDVNNNGIQDEWFDANNDNQITQNIPDASGSFDYSKWEWIDLNGDGSYKGPTNVGELNAAGFGNAKSENIFVTGPNNYSKGVIIGIQGFWRNRPPVGAFGDYEVKLKMNAGLQSQASAIGGTGLVKVIPNFTAKNANPSKTAKPAIFEVCGPTNANPQTASVTATNQVHLDIDFGISCKMFTLIDAINDTFNVTQCSISDGIRNALSNDLLDHATANINLFKFKLLTPLEQNINIDATGNITFTNGVATGQYTFDYQICEAANPTNCDTATITIDVVGIDPITITSTACNGDSTPVDLTALLPQGLPTNGTWIDTENTGGLNGNRLNAFGIPINKYKYEYKITGDCPKSVFLELDINDDCKVLPCENIIVHNALSINEDGKNDYFQIDNIEDNDCYKNIRVEIFNRWGVLVFEKDNYDNEGNAFRGKSEGRTTINKNDSLPTGTYFYILSYDTVDGLGKTLNIQKQDYLYLVQ